MVYIESVRGYPYMTKEGLAEEFHISKSTVYSRMKEIEKEIAKGRYSCYAVINDGNLVLVNALVFIDYLTFRQRLREPTTRKFVPPFNPDAIAREISWKDTVREYGPSSKSNTTKEVLV